MPRSENVVDVSVSTCGKRQPAQQEFDRKYSRAFSTHKAEYSSGTLGTRASRFSFEHEIQPADQSCTNSTADQVRVRSCLRVHTPSTQRFSSHTRGWCMGHGDLGFMATRAVVACFLATLTGLRQ